MLVPYPRLYGRLWPPFTVISEEAIVSTVTTGLVSSCDIHLQPRLRASTNHDSSQPMLEVPQLAQPYR